MSEERLSGGQSDNGLQISSARTGTTTHITVSGELDMAAAPRLREHAGRHLADHAGIIVLDLGAVSFIDSSGLHAVLDAVDRDADRIRIIPSPICRRLFELAGVTSRLPLIDTETPPA